MTLPSIKEETLETLNLLRRKDEDDDALLHRIVEYARCYMIIRGTEDSEHRCLKCGGIVHERKFVDEWNLDGSPVEVVEDWYCPSCKIRWVSFLETKPYEETES